MRGIVLPLGNVYVETETLYDEVGGESEKVFTEIT